MDTAIQLKQDLQNVLNNCKNLSFYAKALVLKEYATEINNVALQYERQQLQEMNQPQEQDNVE